MDKERSKRVLDYTVLATILILVLVILIKTVSGFSYNVATLPYYGIEDVIFNDTRNVTINLTCTNCSFSWLVGVHFDNLSNATFFSYDIIVPNGTPDGNYTDSWFVWIDGNLTNESVVFLFNVSVNSSFEDNVSENVSVANISLSPTPANNSLFGAVDPFPTYVTVLYDGFINFSVSNISLLFNNQSVPSITFNFDNETFWFNLGEAVDGVYSGYWDLVDANGSVLHYNYVFKVKTSPPINPRSVSPGKGQYTDDVVDLRVTMEAPEYTIYYVVSDGFPLTASGGWNLMSSSEDQFFVLDLDFASLDLGAIYIKIIDEYENIAIYPTAIISAPMVEIEVDDRIRRADQGDTLNFDITLRIKEDSGNLLRCKLEDFIDMDSKKFDFETKEAWAIPRIAYLVDDDEEYALDTEFDETIDLDGDRSRDLELIIDVPKIAEKGEDYSSLLECIVTG